MPVGYDPLVGVTFDWSASSKRSRFGEGPAAELAPEPIARGCETKTVVTRGKAYKESPAKTERNQAAT